MKYLCEGLPLTKIYICILIVFQILFNSVCFIDGKVSSLTFFDLSFSSFLCDVQASNLIEEIDIEDAVIDGNNAEYLINLPSEWISDLVVYREKITNSSILLEKLDFYLKSANKNSKDIYIMSLFIYDKIHWESTHNYIKVIESDDYVVTMFLANMPSSLINTDKILFNYYAEEFTNIRKLVENIEFAKDENAIKSLRIFVNGILLDETVFIRDDYRPYLPIRDICEHLGYEVKWSSDPQQVNVVKDKQAYNIHVDDSNSSYGATIINNKTYISDLFFIHTLKASVEVDSFGNIYIMQN